MENWIDLHPWLTFVLGMMGLLTINTMFVSLGGGYKKFPPAPVFKEEEKKRVLDD
jgi:hypothetical protein